MIKKIILRYLFVVGRFVSSTYAINAWIRFGEILMYLVPYLRSSKLKIKLYEFLYYFFFSSFSFRHAYYAKYYSLGVILDNLPKVENNDKCYYSLKWQYEIYKYFIFNKSETPKMDFMPNGMKVKKNEHAIIIGPKFSANKIVNYGEGVFLKPHMPTEVNLTSVVLIQNDTFYNRFKSEVDDWVKKYKGKLILSDALNLPSFALNASLMGLQRAIYHSINIGLSKNIELNGFDLNTERDQYFDNYPSLLPKDLEAKKFQLHYSLARHDYLINLMFLKCVTETTDIVFTGHSIDIVNNFTIPEILNKFMNALK